MTPPSDKPENKGTPLDITLDLGELTPFWEHAIVQALQNGGFEVISHAKPAFQSGAETAHEPTNILIGNGPTNAPHAIQCRINRLAQRVGGINETTRARLETLLARAHESATTADEMRHRLPQIAEESAPTTAHTEQCASQKEIENCEAESPCARTETETQHSEDILALRRADFEIRDGWLTIEEPHFFGECASSPNERFVLAWGERTSGGDGRQEKEHYLLFDGANIVARGTMKRPAEGIVADNGNFVLNDWAEDSANTAHIFDCGGAIIFKKKAESWAGICGISADGRFVIWEIMDDDFRAEPASGTAELAGGNAWQLFDLTTRKKAGKIQTVLGEATSQQIDSEKQIVTFTYSNGLTHRYAFDGTFLDAAAWQTAFRDYASGYELLRVAEERLPSLTNGDASAIADVIDLLSRALTQKISEYTQARVHRHLGELRLRCGDKAGAIEHLESATQLYPKIGVKKLLATLKQADTHRE